MNLLEKGMVSPSTSFNAHDMMNTIRRAEEILQTARTLEKNREKRNGRRLQLERLS